MSTEPPKRAVAPDGGEAAGSPPSPLKGNDVSARGAWNRAPLYQEDRATADFHKGCCFSTFV